MKLINSESKRSFSTDIQPLEIAGWIVFLMMFVGFFAWASLAPLSSASIATGKLVTEVKTQAVQHHKGGIIKELLVNEGQWVETGQALLILKDPALETQYELLQQRKFSAESRLQRLDAQLSGETLTWDTAVGLSTKQHRIQGEEAILLEQNRKLQLERLASLDERIQQQKDTLNALESWLGSDTQALEILFKELEINQGLLSKGYVAEVTLFGLQREVTTLQAKLAEHQSGIDRTKSEIIALSSEKEAIVLQAQQKIREEKQLLTAQIAEIDEQLNASSQLNSLEEIRSPVAGRVINLTAHTNGGVIEKGRTILEVVPKDTRVIASVRINPKDVESVHEGLNANVRLTAFSFRKVPLIDGYLSYLSADIKVDEVTGDTFYEGEIILNASELAQLNLNLKPGMPVQAQLVLEQRTLLDYLLAPLLSSIETGMREQ